jgi:hypothetical protein
LLKKLPRKGNRINALFDFLTAERQKRRYITLGLPASVVLFSKKLNCMNKLLLALLFFNCNFLFAQVDSADKAMKELDKWAPKDNEPKNVVKVFYSQKLINANTVEVLHKGAMEFKVIHNFYDIGSSRGGIHNFFGLDNAADVKIVFQVGLTNKLNIVAGRTRGDQFQNVTELWELGLKYKWLQQMADSRHPISLTSYVNLVASGQKSSTAVNQENSFHNFGDRLSQLVQVMVARKFGKISLELIPSFVHTATVVPGDQNSLFALGAGVRIPITKNFCLIADWYHPFRSQQSKDTLNALKALHPDNPPSYNNYDKYGAGYDVVGIGVEILTTGHVFHLNFTNATNILENRFIPRTLTSWGKGQYRWGFTIARNFILFRDKKKGK